MISASSSFMNNPLDASSPVTGCKTKSKVFFNYFKRKSERTLASGVVQRVCLKVYLCVSRGTGVNQGEVL